jgi:hypothetical protein
MPSSPGLLDLARSAEGLYALDNPPPCYGAPKLTHRLRACSNRHGDASPHATDVKSKVEAAFTFRPREPVSNHVAELMSCPDFPHLVPWYPCWLINFHEVLGFLASSRLASPTTPTRSVCETLVLRHVMTEGLGYSMADDYFPRLDCVAWDLGRNTLSAQYCLLLRTSIRGSAAPRTLGPCCLHYQWVRPEGKTEREKRSLAAGTMARYTTRSILPR